MDEPPFWESEFGIIFWRTWLVVASLLLIGLMGAVPALLAIVFFRSLLGW